MGTNPQDPRKKRLPIPEQYPYEPEVMEAPEELPELPVREFQAPAIPLTPGLNRPTGPGTLEPTPFQSLGQFRQWYTGQPTDVLPGDVLPPSPEWGKRTPSYSRLNPPPPRMGASLPGQRPGVIARQPGTTPSPIVAPVGTPAGQPVPAIRSGQVMQPSTIPTPSQMAPRLAGQLPSVTKRDFLNTDWLEQRGQGVPQGMQVSIDRRNLTPGFSPAGQNVRPGTQVKAGLAVAPQGRALTPEERQLRTEAVIANRLAQPGQPSIEEEAITRGKQGIQQGIKDAALELYAGIPRVGSTFLNVADAIARTTGAAPVGQPGATYTQGRQPLAPSVFRRGAQALESKSEEILGRRSPDIQAREQQLNVKLAQQQDDILNQIATVAATVYKDPALARKAILTNLPMMLPPLLAGKVASTANIASALAARMTTGAIMAAGDAASSIYDTNKQALLARGIPEAEADQEAFRKSIIGLPIGATLGGLSSGTGFEAGLAGGGLGARLTARLPQGVKQLGAKAAGLAGSIGRRAAPGITELSTEVAEETIPQVIGNVQAGLPASRNIGRTVAETIIATSPFAVQASIGKNSS